MRNAFISGISLYSIWQCLFENKTQDLQTAYTQTSALDLAQWNNLYTTPEALMAATVNPEPTKISDQYYEVPFEPNKPAVATTHQAKHECFFVDLPIICGTAVSPMELLAKNAQKRTLRSCMFVQTFLSNSILLQCM